MKKLTLQLSICFLLQMLFTSNVKAGGDIFNDTLVIVEPGGIVERSKRIAPRRSVLPPFTPTLPAKKYVASPALNAPLGSSINVLSADDVSTN